MKNITEALKELRPTDMVLMVFEDQNCAVVQTKFINGKFDNPSICYYDNDKKNIYFIPIHLFKTFREMPEFDYDFCTELKQRITIDNKPRKEKIQKVYDTIRQSKYSQIIDNYEFTWGVCTIHYFIKNIKDKFNLSGNELNVDVIRKIFNHRLTIEQNLSNIIDPKLIIL